MVSLPRHLLASPRSWIGAIALFLVGLLAWFPTAYPRGMLVAWVDHQRGHYEVLAYHPTHPAVPQQAEAEYSKLLEDKYRVKVKWVTERVTSPAQEEYFAGYNAVSERLLRKKHGVDVFRDCAREEEANRRLILSSNW
jgi:hypothetical protein